MKEFASALNEFFKNKPEPRNEEEERKQMEEFLNWYNNIRKQTDTGKTPSEMGSRPLALGLSSWTDDMIACAEAAIHEGDFGEALDIANEITEEEPENIEGWSIKAQALTSLERFKEAEKCIKKCFSLDSNNPAGYLHMANLIMFKSQMMKIDTALEWIDKGLAFDPENFDLVMSKSQMLYLLENDEWKKWFSRAEKLDRWRARNFKKNFWMSREECPVGLMKHIEKAYQTAKKGDVKEAVESLIAREDLKELEELKDILLAIEIEKLLQEKKVEEAEKKVKELSKLNPEHPYVHMFKASSAARENKLDQALEILDRAIEKDKRNELKFPSFYFLKAELLEKAGKGEPRKWREMGEKVHEENQKILEAGPPGVKDFLNEGREE